MIRHSFIIALLLCAVNLFSGAPVLAASNLQSINRTDESAYMQFFLHFDKLPTHTTATHGRRVDLMLEDTSFDASMESPEVDSRMIKMTRTQKDGNTTLSFYFRYPPQKVTLKGSTDGTMLLVDVLLGNQIVAATPELAAHSQNVTVFHRRDVDTLNPMKIAVYGKDWKRIFSDYESEVTISPPPILLLPPFPLAAVLKPQIPDDQWLSAETSAQAQANKWNQVSLLLRRALNEQPNEQLKERILLTYAEALVRAGEYQEPYGLLQRIALEYPDTLMADLAQLLFLYIQATKGDHFGASYELGHLKNKLQNLPFQDYIALLLAEMALAGDRVADAAKALEQVGDHHPQLKALRALRQADILTATKQGPQALALYEETARNSELLKNDPMSLANFAGLLYAAKRYDEAGKQYQNLADLLADDKAKGLAMFKQAMCELHAPGAERKARLSLMQVQEAFGRTEASMRAQLKLTDLDYLAAKIKPKAAAAIYGEVADAGTTVPLREEAWFKQAVVLAQSNDSAACVDRLVAMLRVFQSGKLRMEATGLLIEQLPIVLKQLVENKEYVKALVLAKQNRELFAKGWLATGPLLDLARAYSQLGLVDQSAQTYQYLLDVSADDKRERIYLPLIQMLVASGQYVQAEEFANRYALRYPKGRDGQAVYFFKIQSLYASGQLDKALELLRNDEAPLSPQVEALKARIFFDQKQWTQVIAILEKSTSEEHASDRALQRMLAESYFQAGQDAKAQPLFTQIVTTDKDNEQARFRLAQIAQRSNDTELALNLYKELAEKKTTSPWTRLAGEEAALLQLQLKNNSIAPK